MQRGDHRIVGSLARPPAALPPPEGQHTHHGIVVVIGRRQFAQAAQGGNGGGIVIAKGTPEQVAETKKSYTGEYLKKVLRR